MGFWDSLLAFFLGKSIADSNKKRTDKRPIHNTDVNHSHHDCFDNDCDCEHDSCVDGYGLHDDFDSLDEDSLDDDMLDEVSELNDYDTYDDDSRDSFNDDFDSFNDGNDSYDDENY